MNGTERIMAALSGQRADRKAYTAVLSQYGSRFTSASLQEFYQDPEIYSSGQLAVYDKFEPDVIFGPFALALIAKAFGAELKFYPDRPPILRRPMVASVDDLLKFPVPDVDNQPEILYLRQCIQLLTKQLGGKVPVAAISLNPVDLPIMIYGMDTWVEYFLLDKQAFYKTLNYVIPFFTSLSNALIADGAACVIMPTVFANAGFVSLKQTKDIVNPILKEAFSGVNGALVMHHGGLPMLAYLDTFSDLPQNVIGFGIDAKDDYLTARKIVGEGKLLFSGIDGPSLYTKTREEVLQSLAQVQSETRDDPRHVLYTCGSDILNSTPEENIFAMKEFVCKDISDKMEKQKSLG